VGRLVERGQPKRVVIIMRAPTAKAILTDSQFWVPVVVLALGIMLLVYLH
jgi:hypothetical protein